ncbi:FtsX-like permease family protein [Chitinophaga agrisoli]|uniref:FtsX-like permease family protein n=1 Tax=Chitinophaga agrisoli TaxID=2607653 RepID=A0A5B2VNI8_9BACT|nr:ABC transporter permease [Chitinophaga agrisoli]KAA2239777.1 FtsX-like permease family protein [Chitinophaga agrisoli]
MLTTHFKTAWRYLRKEGHFTLLNICSLSTGLACALLIWLWTADELAVDHIFAHNDRLYQVMKNAREPDGHIQTYSMTPGPLSQALAADMPEVEFATGVYVPAKQTGVLTAGDTHLRVKEQYVGPDFLQVFSYPLLEGDRLTALREPTKVVITDALALKLFHTTRGVVGKSVTWNNDPYSGTYLVAGVVKSPPANATAQFEILFPYALYLRHEANASAWTNSEPNTYILLKAGASQALFSKKLGSYLQAKTGEAYQSLFIRPYSSSYLYGRYVDGVQAGGRIGYIRLFMLVGIFILVIACVNFMNLSTARAAGRSKEVGIKKAVGARRGTLILQYLAESVLLAFLSLIIALLLTLLLLWPLHQLTGKQLSLPLNAGMLLFLVGITLFTGLLAGSYPAFYLSGFAPVRVLKGPIKTSARELLVRKGLVIFQFVISVILIVAVLVVYQQVSFIHSKNLGLHKDHVIVLQKDGALANHTTPFLEAASSINGVVHASVFGRALTNNGTGTQGISWEGMSPDQAVTFKYLFVGYGFIETMGIRMLDGQPFTRGGDSMQIIFNEAAIKAMGLKDPIGKTVTQWKEKKRIVGVVNDFHFESLYEPVKPCFFILAPQSPDAGNIAILLRAGSEKATLAQLEQLYKQYNPGFPFSFKFLDQDYQLLYTSENQVAVLFRYFAAIAIVICCLGLLGLAAFTAQRRQKEIGIRKVLGATAGNIVLLLSKDFLTLVLISLPIAFPVAGWMSYNWLQHFAYRISLGASVFLITGAAIVLITLLTVSLQSIKAALADPVKSLHTA